MIFLDIGPHQLVVEIERTPLRLRPPPAALAAGSGLRADSHPRHPSASAQRAHTPHRQRTGRGRAIAGGASKNSRSNVPPAVLPETYVFPAAARTLAI